MNDEHGVQTSTGPGGIPLVTLENTYGSARISLLGATLIDWTPAGQAAVVWLSRSARFEQGKGIRGGVPVCWPWFGAHPTHADWPQHGLVRTRLWQHVDSSRLDDGSTLARFSFDTTRLEHWPHSCGLEYRVKLGQSLRLELITSNTGDAAFEITQALHTYFDIGDIHQVSVRGLDGITYLDKPAGFTERSQQGDIHFDGEVDRIYLDTDAACTIEDPLLRRRIVIDKQGSNSTVVWNPWQHNSDNMADMHEDAYRTMVCVETANAAADRITLGPGDEHRLAAIYSVTPS